MFLKRGLRDKLIKLINEIIFRTEAEILKELDVAQMTDEIQTELKISFDDKQIKKYEIIFEEGVVVKQCHNFEDISEKIVSVLTITVA